MKKLPPLPDSSWDGKTGMVDAGSPHLRKLVADIAELDEDIEVRQAAQAALRGRNPELTEFLDRGRSGSNASTFLTRLQLGGTVVDGRVIASLYRNRVSAGAVLLMIAAALVAVLAALLVSDAGDAVVAFAITSWQALLGLVGGWFS